jgi:hypothetical protein
MQKSEKKYGDIFSLCVPIFFVLSSLGQLPGKLLTERFGVQQTAVLPQRIQSSFTIKS